MLGAQEVACGEVREAVAVDEARALGAFAGAWAAQDENYWKVGVVISLVD